MKNNIPKLDKNQPGIYKILNLLTNDYYIGSTSHLSRRCSTHKFQLNRNIHGNQKLQNAWNKYKEDAFEFQLIQICKKEELLTIEQKYLDLKPDYNIKFEAGYSNHNFKPSPSHIAKIKAANLGRKMNDETKDLLRKAHLGKKLSDETRKKISDKLKGRVISQEVRNNMNKINKGKKRIGFRPHTTKLVLEQVIKIKQLLKDFKPKEVFEKLKNENITKTQIIEISCGRAWSDIKI